MNRASTTERRIGRAAARLFRSPSVAAGVALGFILLSASLWWWPKPATIGATRPGQPTLEQLKRSFARPSYLPQPADNPATPAKLALGQRLFEDKRLSVTGTISCSSCHNPKLAFTDGEDASRGVSGRPLVRHTPSLWNVAWSPLLMWDGRASSLEDQIRLPLTHPDEMGATFQHAVERLAADADYTRAFAEAFPGSPGITSETIAKALAAFERSLVSPPTRFDRWIAGDASALSPSEQNGFAIFTGRARCINCHTGFAFTDHGFYDIGLPSEDMGRGPILGLPVADQAFKTPTLRELAWTAPYTHNGSIGTLDDLIRIYEMGGVERPTRSRDLPQNLRLTDEERDDLIAFLEALSSEAPPKPSTEAWIGNTEPPRPQAAADTTVVSQLDKLFNPSRVRLQAGQTLSVLNDDTRTHNVRIGSPTLDYNSGAQEPKQTITIRFPDRGTYEAFCGIHPTMRLAIEVQ
jgi:cytochrome c peroxidase